jgi:hypothetical protein
MVYVKTSEKSYLRYVDVAILFWLKVCSTQCCQVPKLFSGQ